MEPTRVKLTIPESIDLLRLMGPADAILRRIEDSCGAMIAVRSNQVSVTGSIAEVQRVTSILSSLMSRVEAGHTPTLEDVNRLLTQTQSGVLESTADDDDDIILSFKGRDIRPKTPGQKAYIDSIRANTITFGVGPAGTGKTYLAMSMAVARLKRQEVQRIVLARPVVEAGESLGFLPGTLQEKLDPYVRPLLDALFEMTDAEYAHTLIEQGVIEIAPLAFMRGRTFNNSFVILDEAQNTTPEQMKMFLTRLGFSSTFVVTGDITQRDLSGTSGLESARRVLCDMDDINFVELDRSDIVRHSLVSRIVGAYERDAQTAKKPGSREQANSVHSSKGQMVQE